MHLPVLEGIGALDTEPARLERAEARRDHHGLRDEPRAGRRGQVEAAVLARTQLDHLLAEVELGPERLDLLHQPVDQLLGAAHGQRRDVVDGLVRVQLGALPARVLQGVDDVRLDAEQPQLEDLEQPRRACADDDGVGLDRGARADGKGVCHGKLQGPAGEAGDSSGSADSG